MDCSFCFDKPKYLPSPNDKHSYKFMWKNETDDFIGILSSDEVTLKLNRNQTYTYNAHSPSDLDYWVSQFSDILTDVSFPYFKRNNKFGPETSVLRSNKLWLNRLTHWTEKYHVYI